MNLSSTDLRYLFNADYRHWLIIASFSAVEMGVGLYVG